MTTIRQKANISYVVTTKPPSVEKRLDVVIVSVNYNDFLSLTLEKNTKIFDNITVVTSSDDEICKRLCDKFGVKCLQTDVMYENGDKFNKGKAINFGIKSLENPEFVLLLDADCIVENKILTSQLETDVIYTAGRIIIESYDRYCNWIKDKTTKTRVESNRGLGFFHLFNMESKKINKNCPYSENFSNADGSDLLFRNLFDRKEDINNKIIHLGVAYKNWKGRKSPDFFPIENVYDLLGLNIVRGEQIQSVKEKFDINSYFDKIYCINLDRRKDKWYRVKKEFQKNSINVERWSAIDGESLVDISNFEKNQNLLSKRGELENKYSLACLMSHLSVIKDAKINNYKKILIFEDDVILSDNFSNKIEMIQNVNWKLFYLGASQFIWNGISIEGEFYRCNQTLGTFAYAVDNSIYDDLIEIFESKTKSVDNLLTLIQKKYLGYCFTIFPNITISNVSDSEIRRSKDLKQYSKNMKWDLNLFSIKSDGLKILLIPDIRGWAFDNIAKSIIKYNPYPNKITYDIKYITDIYDGYKIDYDNWDYIFVFFEAESEVINSKKVIRGCYSAFWIEDSKFSQKNLANNFNECVASVYANDFLQKSLAPYLDPNHKKTIIHDSSDETKFYPISGLKKEEFTVIFVGNTKRKIKNFRDIQWICEQSGVELVVCENIKNEELIYFYNQVDLCINFSTFEGGPQTFLEASLCEVPMLIRENNELSKLIPCFTGQTKEDFVKIINELKTNRYLCEIKGKEARKVVLDNFTYKKTSEKFAKFFLEVDGQNIDEESPVKPEQKDMNDLSDRLTVFIISCGENPNYTDCLESLSNQNVKFTLKEIKNISPMSKAFQKMINDCETEYYIQVDEDMILFQNSIEEIYKKLEDSDDNISTVTFMLKDVHLDFNLYGIKGYKHNILKNYPYNLEIISCEVEQVRRLQNDGYETIMIEKVLGYHSPKWTPELIYERYFDLMEKWKNFKYHWMGELPAKLLQIFKNEPTNLNFYALSGALHSLSSEENIRKREKNFNIKDENFEKLKKLFEVEKFKHIINRESSQSIILDKNKMFNK